MADDLPDAPWATPASGKELPDAPWTADKQQPAGAGLLENIKSIPHGILGGLSEAASAGAQAETAAMSQPEEMPTKEQVRSAIEQNVTGQLPSGGRYGEAIGEFLGNPASYIGPEGMAVKAGTAATSALGSEFLRHMTEGTSFETYGSMLGAIAGGILPRSFARLATPLPISAERQAAVNALRAEGIEPTAGQVTGSAALKYTESALGDAPMAGGKATEAQKRIAEQFTHAALARVGETADRLSPKVMDRSFKRIGNQFDNLATRNDAVIDMPFISGIGDVVHDYENSVAESLRKPIVSKIADDLANKATLTGEQYKVLRSKIEGIRRRSFSDPEASMALADIRSHMDDLMERSIAANNPSDLGAWREVRNQYRNMLVLEKIASGAGETAAEGLVSPAKLRQSVVSQGKRAYVRGQGDFADLARAGEQILRPLPTSTTMERAFVHTIPATLAGAGAATLAGAHFALPAAAATLAAPGIAGRAVMSQPMQSYLKNQLLADTLRRLPHTTPQAARSLIGSIGANQARGGRIKATLKLAKKYRRP